MASGCPLRVVLYRGLCPTFSTRWKRRAKSIGVYRKSPLQNWDLGASGPLRGRDARRWLRRQIELELLEQQQIADLVLNLTLLPSRRGGAGHRFDQMVRAHLQKAEIISARLADEDCLHRRLH